MRRPLAHLQNLPNSFRTPPQLAVVCRLTFAKRQREQHWTIYTCVANGYLSRFLVEKVSCFFFLEGFHSLDASRALTRLTVSSRSRRRHSGGSR